VLLYKHSFGKRTDYILSVTHIMLQMCFGIEEDILHSFSNTYHPANLFLVEDI
jgi:hypothetical protein